MSSDPYGQAAGTTESFINAITLAPTPAAKASAVAAYENFFSGSGGGGGAPSPASGAALETRIPGAAPTGPADLSSQIRALTERVINERHAPTRDRLNAELGRLHEQAAAGGQTANDANVDPRIAEAAAPASSPNEYAFEHLPGVDFISDEARGELRGDLFAMGMPAPLAGMAVREFERLGRSGVVTADRDGRPQVAERAILAARDAIYRQHGPDAPGIIADAAKFIDALKAAHPKWADDIDALCASPAVIMSAALHSRATGGRVRR